MTLWSDLLIAITIKNNDNLTLLVVILVIHDIQVNCLSISLSINEMNLPNQHMKKTTIINNIYRWEFTVEFSCWAKVVFTVLRSERLSERERV